MTVHDEWARWRVLEPEPLTWRRGEVVAAIISALVCVGSMVAAGGWL